MKLTHEHIRAAGGIVHADGNIFFTDLAKLNAAVDSAAQPAAPCGRVAAVQWVGLSEREQGIIIFALRQLMNEAYVKADAAAQFRDNGHSARAFHKDAKFAEALIQKLHEQSAELDKANV